MANVLIHADSIRSPDLRHVVPLAIGDAFTYAETDGRRIVFIHAIELPRVQELGGGLDVVSLDSLGLDEVLASVSDRGERRLEMVKRACKSVGIEEAVVPPDFPFEVAEHLREAGVSLRADRPLFVERRRAKTGPELEGIRRAQTATEAAMGAIAAAVRGGGDISSESLRNAARSAMSDADVFFGYSIVAHGAQGASVHDPGSGRIEPGESIIVDLGVQDAESGCWSDMSRTFCVGEPPAELVGYQAACLEALERSTELIRPGASCREVYDVSAQVVEDAGFQTLRTKQAGVPLEEGYFHGLGHGVGLEIHEAPSMDPYSTDELVAGDVVTIEPGIYRPGFGGCRLEDLVAVTADGFERLTNFPYDLSPA